MWGRGTAFFADPTLPPSSHTAPTPAPLPRRRARAASWTTSAACLTTWRTNWTPCWNDPGTRWVHLCCLGSSCTLTFTSGWALLGAVQVGMVGGRGGRGAGDSLPGPRGGGGSCCPVPAQAQLLPLGPGKMPGVEDCLAWGPKGSGQMLLLCGCLSLSAAPCAITAGLPAHPPPGSLPSV